jgi:hypothetical protein
MSTELTADEEAEVCASEPGTGEVWESGRESDAIDADSGTISSGLLRSMAIDWPTWSVSARRVSGSGLAAGLLRAGAIRPRADRRGGLDRVERTLA